MIEFLFFGWSGALVIIIALATQAIKITREYERVVVFRLGRISELKDMVLGMSWMGYAYQNMRSGSGIWNILCLGACRAL